MFKTLTIIPALIIAVIILAGCGDKKTDTTSLPDNKKEQVNNSTNTTQSTPPTTTTAPDTTKKDTVKTTKTDDKAGGNIMKIETTMGTIKIKMHPENAPKTVARITELVNKGFYDGTIFHRVIAGFMIQGGDPTGTGTGGSGVPIPNEFANGLKHDKKGVVAMANSGRPNSQDSQFYITLAPQPHLDAGYTVFGEVIEGMDVVEKIGAVKTGAGDKPVTEVKMKKVTMSAK